MLANTHAIESSSSLPSTGRFSVEVSHIVTTCNVSTQLSEPSANTLDALDTTALRVGAQREAARALKEHPIHYIDNPSFKEPNAWQNIVESPCPASTSNSSTELDLSASKIPWPIPLDAPLLSREQEQYLFRKMNYLKFYVAQSVANLAIESSDPDLLQKINDCLESVKNIRSNILEANLRLVPYAAKVLGSKNYSMGELLSEGCMAIYRAIDNFDYALGNKFSTYALSSVTRAIIRDKDKYQHWRIGRYVQPQGIDDIEAPESKRSVQEQDYPALQRAVQNLIKKVDPRSRNILAVRYGLDGGNGATLTELGENLGISKQRTRDLEQRALTRLSKEQNPLDDLV